MQNPAAPSGLLSFLLSSVLLSLLPGCGCLRDRDLPRDAPGLRSAAEAASSAAADAARRDDRAATVEAARRAGVALARLRSLEPAASAEDLQAAESAAHFAKRWAALVTERDRRRKVLESWKAGAWRTARRGALGLTLAGLALGADQAAAGRLDQLPEPLRRRASLASVAATLGVSGPTRAPTPAEWAATAEWCRRNAADPPAELGMVVAVPLLLLGKKDLALVEVEGIDQSRLHAEVAGLLPILRGVVYLANGFDNLAGDLIDEAVATPEKQTGGGANAVGWLHMLRVVYYLEEKEPLKADEALGHLLRTQPENPVCRYLAGECHAQGGRYEEAASELERAAAGTPREFLARQIAERARRLRDDPVRCEPLLFDKAFAWQLARAAVEDAALRDEGARRARGLLDAAASLAEEQWLRLPDLGSEPGADPTSATLLGRGRALWDRAASWLPGGGAAPR